MKEIEVKLAIDDADEARRRLGAAGAVARAARSFEDNRLYDDAARSLKDSGRLLRLRSVGGRTVLTFKAKPAAGDDPRYKVRDEYETEVADAAAMDRLLRALGAEVVDYPLKTHCCGGHMTVIGPEVAYGLIRRLVHGAASAGADAIVTLCPMCQLNLDAYQIEMNKFFKTDYAVPVLYFTQLMGLAFGHAPAELGIGKEFVAAGPVLNRIQPEPPPAPEVKRKRRPRIEDGLPMPRMG